MIWTRFSKLVFEDGDPLRTGERYYEALPRRAGSAGTAPIQHFAVAENRGSIGRRKAANGYLFRLPERLSGAACGKSLVMTESVTTEDRPKRRNGPAREAGLVSANALATHLGCTSQYIARLAADAVIERRGGGYDQDHCRLRYIAHLRSANRRSPRAAADAEHASAKAALLRLRIAEKKRELMPVSDHNAFIDELAGLVLTKLGGLPARVGGSDLGARRRAEAALLELRREISAAATRMADEAGEARLAER
jgi:hypothetical protein